MSYQSKFCTQCGNQLPANARFCGECGTPVKLPNQALYQAPAQPPPAPPVYQTPPPSQYAPLPHQTACQPAPGEPVLAVVGGLSRSHGFFKQQSFSLVVTPLRLIFAELSSDMLKQAAADAKSNARAQGKSFLGQWGAVIGSSSALLQRYYQMPVETILRESSANFQIAHQQVQRLQYRWFSNDDGPTTYSLEIRTPGGKYKFNLSSCLSNDQRRALKDIYGSNFKG